MGKWRISLKEFLCGAEKADPWCRQKFEDYIGDIEPSWDSESLDLIREDERFGRFYFARGANADLLLRRAKGSAGLEIVGYYLGPGAVCLREDIQGMGLGAELILRTAMERGEPPTIGLDEQMFSEAGLAAHKAAYRLGAQRGWIEDPNPEAPPKRKAHTRRRH